MNYNQKVILRAENQSVIFQQAKKFGLEMSRNLFVKLMQKILDATNQRKGNRDVRLQHVMLKTQSKEHSFVQTSFSYSS